MVLWACVAFQSTPSVWRETKKLRDRYPNGFISIHSLRMEGDTVLVRQIGKIKTFQSTPSVWRETVMAGVLVVDFLISIHSLRMEGDTEPLLPLVCHGRISIHSLRMEGD